MTERWQRLVTCAEERHKLVTASLNFYKTAEQVCSVLDSLEREYRRDEDWCGSGGAPADELALAQPVDKAAQVRTDYPVCVTAMLTILYSEVMREFYFFTRTFFYTVCGRVLQRQQNFDYLRLSPINQSIKF